jgi:hypothetical protein
MMVTHDIENVRKYVQERMGCLPRIEEKLESTSNKIQYLVRRIDHLSKNRNNGEDCALTNERLHRIVERLDRLGLIVEYTDGRGYVKLKAVEQRGLDAIKRMNTIFQISLIESYLDNLAP